MKRILLFLIAFTLLLMWSSCRKDFEFSPNTGNLEFAKDTVYLDTLFTNIGSSTYNLKVYNRSDNDIVIPTIQLQNGVNSYYRLNVDGSTGLSGEQEGKFFENVELLANDSLYIFIETTININNLPAVNHQFLYTDKILFDAGSNQQDVDLVTLVRDAVFIYPNQDANGIIETLNFDTNGDGTPEDSKLQGRFLTDAELTFTNQKPYVIYGYAAVDEGKTLTIEAGARVHFHANSGLLVTNNATLNCNGALSTNQENLENEIIFEGDRLEPGFANVPGQWGTIWLFSGSTNHNINYTTIKNATIGILTEGNANTNTTNYNLNISNSQIYNSSAFGILGSNTSINAQNIVINNSGQTSFAGTYGGKYNLTHCTIANYWANSFRQLPALLFNDFVIDENNTIFTNPLTQANVNNSIVYGNSSTEFFLEQQGNNFSFKFNNNLLRFNNSALQNTGNYMFDDATLYEGNIFNADPSFKNTSKNQLQISHDSAANGIGSSLFSTQVPNDILGTTRNSTPDAGAYESVTFED